MLKNRTMVITGANQGIGFETVRRCSLKGANVFAVVRNAIDDTLLKLKKIEAESGCPIKIFECDFLNEESIKNCASTILAEKVPLSGIVNVASIFSKKKSFESTSTEEIKKIFEVNLFGPLFFTQKLLKNMIRSKKGSIVNVSSTAAFDGDPGGFEYCSSKAALIGATKKISRELAAFGIRVNAVAPGIMDADMAKSLDETDLQEVLNRTPLKRLAKPVEIAETIVWLLSDESSFITGQTIRVDGGL